MFSPHQCHLSPKSWKDTQPRHLRGVASTPFAKNNKITTLPLPVLLLPMNNKSSFGLGRPGSDCECESFYKWKFWDSIVHLSCKLMTGESCYFGSGGIIFLIRVIAYRTYWLGSWKKPKKSKNNNMQKVTLAFLSRRIMNWGSQQGRWHTGGMW